MIKFLLIFALAISAWAAPYNVVADITGTSNVITLQNSITPKKASGNVMNVYCAADCVVDCISGGTAPTGTLDNTLVAGDEFANPPVGFDVYKNSDTSGGNLRSRHFVKAGGTLPIPIKRMSLKGRVGSRFTIKVTFPGGGSNRSIINIDVDGDI